MKNMDSILEKKSFRIPVFKRIKTLTSSYIITLSSLDIDCFEITTQDVMGRDENVHSLIRIMERRAEN